MMPNTWSVTSFVPPTCVKGFSLVGDVSESPTLFSTPQIGVKIQPSLRLVVGSSSMVPVVFLLGPYQGTEQLECTVVLSVWSYIYL